MIEKNNIVTRKMLTEAFRKIGIKKGDNLAIHSSLKSIGFIEGGAETVIKAIEEVITESGTLIMPTHTYSLPMWDKAPYEKTKTPSIVGKITDIFWRMPGVLRSDHPTHSISALGKKAEEFTRDTLKNSSVGPGSPWYRFYNTGGKILMIGTDLKACTVLHTCEVLAEVPYLNIAFTPNQDYETAHFLNKKGETEKYILKPVPGCSNGFSKAEDFLREKGILKDVKVLNAKSQIFSVTEMVNAIIENLKNEPYFLLCENPDCGICPRRYKVRKEKEEMPHAEPQSLQRGGGRDQD
jgi:aminoglycoside 3-N-acetyltransferase